MTKTHRLLGCRGCGSTIVEAAFAVAGLLLEYEEVDYDHGSPAKWVEDTQQGAKQLRESTDRHRQALWLQLEEAAGAPWFLGSRMSAIDLYVAVMTHWRPGRKWFAPHTPRLLSIAEKTSATAGVADVFERYFG